MYGDPTAPDTLGAGGGYGNGGGEPGGDGGGRMRLVVGALIVEGEVRADGETGFKGGAARQAAAPAARSGSKPTR